MAGPEGVAVLRLRRTAPVGHLAMASRAPVRRLTYAPAKKGGAMERPKPQQRDGWPVGLQFVLGMAGIIITVAGVIALQKGMQPKPATTPAPVIITAEEQARLDSLTAERRIIDQRTSAAGKPDPDYLPGRPEVLNSRELEAKGFRCISGQLFRKVGNEWQQLGRC